MGQIAVYVKMCVSKHSWGTNWQNCSTECEHLQCTHNTCVQQIIVIYVKHFCMPQTWLVLTWYILYGWTCYFLLPPPPHSHTAITTQQKYHKQTGPVGFFTGPTGTVKNGCMHQWCSFDYVSIVSSQAERVQSHTVTVSNRWPVICKLRHACTRQIN